MDVEIRVETLDEFDGRTTSRLARRAFGRTGPELSTERFNWAYRHGYERVSIIAAFYDGAKVGQLVCFPKTVLMAGRVRQVAELVDLFVSPDFRGFKVASRLYESMRNTLKLQDTELVYAYANEKAAYLNRQYFGAGEDTRLPVYVGAQLRFLKEKKYDIELFEKADEIAEACIHCANSFQTGLTISREQLARRISSPIFKFFAVSNGNIAIIGSPRVIRSTPLMLICATFNNLHSPPSKETISGLMATLCGAADRNIFLYAGWNDALNFRQGIRLPNCLLRGALLIQSNWLNSCRGQLGRFELIDIDYV